METKNTCTHIETEKEAQRVSERERIGFETQNPQAHDIGQKNALYVFTVQILEDKTFQSLSMYTPMVPITFQQLALYF